MWHAKQAELREDGVPHRPLGRVSPIAARNLPTARIDLNKTRPAPFPTLWIRVCAWCLPWNVFSYPGHLKGISTLLAGVGATTIQYWKRSDRPPVWAAVTLRDYIRSRCALGLSLADELDEYIRKREAEPPRRYPATRRAPADRDGL